MEWARDSAYRFFPLVQHTDLGLVLHPFDLATNKVLALVGRLEPRDWVDFTGSATEIPAALARRGLRLHRGCIRGAFPKVR